MAYQSEAALEQQFIEQLTKQEYTTVAIPDYDALVENFKVQFEAFNAPKLDGLEPEDSGDSDCIVYRSPDRRAVRLADEGHFADGQDHQHQQNRPAYLRQEERRIVSSYRTAENEDLRSNDSCSVSSHEYHQEVLRGKPESLFPHGQDQANRAENISAVFHTFLEAERIGESEVS